MNIFIDGSGYTHFMGQKIAYQIGKQGIISADLKREGDRKTPTGFLKPLALFYRAGRMIPPKTWLPIYKIKPYDGWCDESNSALYNQHIHHPFGKSAEHLVRSDRLYDMLLVTDYNYPESEPSKGSAIFIHVMHPDRKPTQGCIAFEPYILKRIISAMRPNEGFIVK